MEFFMSSILSQCRSFRTLILCCQIEQVVPLKNRQVKLVVKHSITPKLTSLTSRRLLEDCWNARSNDQLLWQCKTSQQLICPASKIFLLIYRKLIFFNAWSVPRSSQNQNGNTKNRIISVLIMKQSCRRLFLDGACTHSRDNV